jgi:nickel-dependent lactate racemase
MKVNLLYGEGHKEIKLPDHRSTVINPPHVFAYPSEESAIKQALRNPICSPPLRELVNPEDTVAIVFSDITRPMPNDRVLPVLLDELNQVPKDQIVLINALGTHRANTQNELIDLLGPKIVSQYQIIQHDCYDENNLTNLGKTSRGNQVFVNSTYMKSTIRILTGLIEPHLFAGFSGGPKAVLPGIAGADTIFSNHGSSMIADPRSNFAHTNGNPIWEEMQEVALKTKPTFILNVTLTGDRHISGVFAGDMQKTFQKGVKFLKNSALIEVDDLYDIAITTAGGYPLDLSLYQSVKGIKVASDIVRDGGTILLVSACLEGLPDYGEFGEIMRLSETPEDLLTAVHTPGFSMQDQWDAQIHAQICKRFTLHIYSDGLTDDEIRQVFGIPSRDLEHTMEVILRKCASNARIAVLPSGPLAVPYIQDTQTN